MTRRLLSLLGMALSLSFVYGQQIIDGIAAVVGEHIILKSDVAQLVQMSAVERHLDPNKDVDRILQLEDQIIENLISQKLILEIAAVESIEVAEREVNTALDQYIDSYVSRLGSEKRVEEAFGRSINELRREWWPDMQEQLIGEKFRNELLKDISVTRDEVLAFYSDYHDSLHALPTLYDTRHILFAIRPGKVSRLEAWNLISSLRERILSGDSFSEIARQFSNDPGSAKAGGELGFVSRGTFVPSFEQVAFALEPGQTSQIVETQFGYHIIQLVEKMGEKINVRHILISPKVSDADRDSVYSFAEAIRDSIASEQDWAAFASKYSADLSTREESGSLGWVDPSTFPVPEISHVLPALSVGEVSPPIPASDGIHLILISGVRAGGVPTIDTHWAEIEGMALAKKRATFFNQWLSRALSSVYVKHYTNTK